MKNFMDKSFIPAQGFCSVIVRLFSLLCSNKAFVQECTRVQINGGVRGAAASVEITSLKISLC